MHNDSDVNKTRVEIEDMPLADAHALLATLKRSFLIRQTLDLVYAFTNGMASMYIMTPDSLLYDQCTEQQRAQKIADYKEQMNIDELVYTDEQIIRAIRMYEHGAIKVEDTFG